MQDELANLLIGFLGFLMIVMVSIGFIAGKTHRFTAKEITESCVIGEQFVYNEECAGLIDLKIKRVDNKSGYIEK